MCGLGICRSASCGRGYAIRREWLGEPTACRGSLRRVILVVARSGLSVVTGGGHAGTNEERLPTRSQQVVLEESAVIPEWRILRHPPGGQPHDTAYRAPRMSQIIVRQLIHRPSTKVTHEGERTCVN